MGVKEGKDKVGVNVEGRYKIRKDLGVSGGLNGYKAEGKEKRKKKVRDIKRRGRERV
ncbi:MAG: hypothetical protein LBQ04_01380 [Endomicrobium sp.]|nr:hypothetical protein [Endomicrobium sp.]